MSLTQNNSALEQILNLVKNLPEGSQTLKFTDNNSVVIKFTTSANTPIYSDFNVYDAGFNLLASGTTLSQDAVYYILTDKTDIDLSEKNLKTLEFLQGDKVNKLICHTNALVSLSLSKCINLRYLHMFNNPMCDDNAYITALVECLNGLPDRSDRGAGSIIYSPWYGLPVLCSLGLTAGNRPVLWKYPHSAKEYIITTNKTIQPFYNQYIGFVPSGMTLQNDNGEYTEHYKTGSIRYYYINEKGSLGKDTNSVAMERHQNLRQILEKTRNDDSTTLSYETAPLTNIANPPSVPAGKGLLNKNWFFGSAIQYSEEWNTSCPRQFDAWNIADFWESAEYGLGINFGLIDLYHSKFSDLPISFQRWNIKQLTTPPDTATNGHANTMMYILFGRGQEDGTQGNYGIIPQASLVAYYTPLVSFEEGDKLIDKGTDTYLPDCMQRCIKEADANIFTFSNGYGENFNYEDYYATPSALPEQSGKNLGQLMDEITLKYPVLQAASNWGIGGPWHTGKALNESTTGPQSYLVTSINNKAYRYDSSAVIQDTNNLQVIAGLSDLYYCGDIGSGWKDYTMATGTSQVCPYTGAYLGLLRNIYWKLFPEKKNDNNGFNSDFMNYVHAHWVEFPEIAKSQTNFGYPNIMTESPKDNRKEYQYDFDYNQFALIDNKLEPIRPLNNNTSLNLYSNTEDLVAESPQRQLIINANTAFRLPSNTILGSTTPTPSGAKNWTHQIVFTPKELKSSTLVSGYYNSTINFSGDKAYIKADTIGSTASVYNYSIWQYGSEKLYLRQVGANCAQIYPSPIEEANIWTCLAKPSNKNPQYSWLVFGNSAPHLFPLYSLWQLHFDPEQKVVLTVSCENGNLLRFYYNGTKIKEYMTAFDNTVEPDATGFANTTGYYYSQVLSDREVLDNTIALLNQ